VTVINVFYAVTGLVVPVLPRVGNDRIAVGFDASLPTIKQDHPMCTLA